MKNIMNFYSKKGKGLLAARFRNINIIFVVFILFIMGIVSSLLIYNLADRASRDYVRFYTMETVDILGAHLNREISLVQHAANAKEIIEWFADEDNPVKKREAFNKMMYFAEMQQIEGLYFAVNKSKNEYSIDAGASFDDFKPYNVLHPGVPHDRWFFDALDSTFDYILKLDTVKSLDNFYIWVDHKVKKFGEVVGIFSSGLPYDYIFADLFGQYDSKSVIGFIIDDKGIIQMDSTVPDAAELLGADSVYDAENMRHISNVDFGSDFNSAISRYLKYHDIHYHRRVQPDVFKLSNNDYQYMSIALVPHTNWLAITLYNSSALFRFTYILLPVIVVILAFAFYVMVVSVLIQRFVFKPLNNLTLSVFESNHDSKGLYGIHRDDEIGELARTTKEAWNRLNENSATILANMRKMEKQSQVLHAINNMASALYGTENEEKFNMSLPQGIELMANCMELDHVFIWRNKIINGELRFILENKWVGANGNVGMSIDTGHVFSYEADAPSWYNLFSINEFICGLTKEQPETERKILEAVGVISVLAIPVYLHGQFWGFVSFDNCHVERILSQDDIEILHSGSLIIASAINRNIQTVAIKEAHEYSKMMLDSTPLSCSLWNKDRKLFDCNKKILEIFGLSSKEEYEDRIAELSPEYQPDGRHSLDTMLYAVLQTIEKGSLVFEWMHQLPNGEPIPAEITLVRVPHGNEMLVAAYLRDLREQKRMMYQIEQRDMLLQTVNQAASMLLNSQITEFESNLYECMGMMARAVDADRVYIWKNHLYDGKLCATQMLEWSEGAAPQQGNEYTVNVSYKDRIPDWLETLSKGKCINIKTNEMPILSREILIATQVKSIFMAPIFLQDDFWGFVGFDDCHTERIFTEQEAAILRSGCLITGSAFLRHDMTVNLKEAAEVAKAASRSKSAFLAHMSHEIRTPMNSIVGFSELAIDSNNPQKTNDYLGKILENSEWLLQIINDILDISKIESGKMELENIPFDLHEMFAACRTVITPKANEKGLTMHFYAEPSTGKRIYGDPTRLRQVLVNLLSNAVKFTNTGMIKMLAAIKDVKADSITMYFEIKDSGIGIAPDSIEKIFDPFVQAESGTTRKFGGSGLGLPITKNIIEMMGGKLSVESAPGVGSKFSFDLTFDAVDADDDEKIADRIIFSDVEKPTFEGEVLLCEDNVMNQQVICEHLSRVGLKIDVASNGKQGVDMVKDRKYKGEKQYDLIFMDIHMPVMDGLEAAAKIFEYDSDIPIVAMTANVMSNDREIYTSRGMSDCVGKPFTSQELWKCLMKYFKPVKWQKEDTARREQEDSELQQKLINNFIKDNKNKLDEIKTALNAEDVVLAHRLVHTLKSNAGQLNKMLLQKAAEEVESRLKDGENLVTKKQMETLENEFSAAYEALSPLVNERFRLVAEELVDKDGARETLDKVKTLLEDGDTDCLSYVEKLQLIPGSADLIYQIENYDYKLALKLLVELRNNIFR